MLKNIIFDLGGVIYDIRYENIADTFASFGFPHFTEHYTQAAQSDAIDLFEEGKITVPEFRSYIRSIAPAPLTDQQIDDAWNAILIDVPHARVDMLKELKKRFNIYLFSNTNQLNCDKFKVKLREKFGYDIFDELFISAYFSHEMHMRKPLPEAFQFVLDNEKLNPSETLFIDDTHRHIEGAKTVGLNTYLLPKGEDITEMKWLAEWE